VVDVTDLNSAFQSRLDAFRDALTKAGIDTNVISGYRTPEQQAQLYAAYKAGTGNVAAPAWRSFHNYGLAADVTPVNPANYQRMWDMAPQYGLTALKGYDKPHFQMSGDLNSLIGQYKLAGWRPDSAPAPSQGAIAYGGPSAGQPPVGMLARTGAPPVGSSFFDALHQIESGNRNIYSGVDKDYAGQPNSRSQGYDQIDVPTWRQFGKQAGVDLSQYPTPMSAPPAVQDQVASQIPLSRFGQRTQNMLAHQFGQLDTGKTVGQLAAQFTPTQAPGPMDPTAQAGGPGAPLGTPGSAVNPPIPTTPGTTINSTPGSQIAGLGQLAGNLKKALGGADDDKAQGQDQIKPQEMPAAPGARNVSPLLGNPQIYAQRMAGLGQPLSWNATPIGQGQMPGAGYGPQNQPVFGTSLMSQLQMLSDPTWMNQMAGGSYG
jgi:hypothetical protein